MILEAFLPGTEPTGGQLAAARTASIDRRRAGSGAAGRRAAAAPRRPAGCTEPAGLPQLFIQRFPRAAIVLDAPIGALAVLAVALSVASPEVRMRAEIAHLAEEIEQALALLRRHL